MKPINIITLILIFGLQTVFLGHEEDKKWVEFIGASIMMIGWILNMLAICGVFK